MRIAIVNDLSLAREVLRRLVMSISGNTVAWIAEDGDEAVTKAATDRPDVILMDLIMPRLNGVEATRQIMRASPCPILVVTATVSGNYAMVIQAMGVGALDAVETPTFGSEGTILNGEKLVARLAKLRAATGNVTRSWMSVTAAPPMQSAGTHPPLVLLGASTGGPDALSVVLSALRSGFPAPILIAQHIAAEFTPGLVQQLALKCALPVRIAREGERPVPGTVLVAASNDHLELTRDCTLRYTPNPQSYPFRPSIDVLFLSCALHWPRPGIGVLLTGMQTDGAEGLLRLRMAGWHTIAQDEATCVVYGMPKAAAEKRAAIEVLPLNLIGPTISANILSAQPR
ncbi:MAG: chemotaxis response regulator protein-glutamate methylesterase [Planctomycetaceae bacterium]|nr:chemotaxis response regulator protein-glutamate methylesterase [Planctomycetaceae bacterium]